MISRQMELTLGERAGSRGILGQSFVRSRRQQRRQTRATWWFARMRQVVDEAVEPEGSASAARSGAGHGWGL